MRDLWIIFFFYYSLLFIHYCIWLVSRLVYIDCGRLRMMWHDSLTLLLIRIRIDGRLSCIITHIYSNIVFVIRNMIFFYSSLFLLSFCFISFYLVWLCFTFCQLFTIVDLADRDFMQGFSATYSWDHFNSIQSHLIYSLR